MRLYFSIEMDVNNLSYHIIILEIYGRILSRERIRSTNTYHGSNYSEYISPYKVHR